jgi:hypothetical protein
MMLSEEATLLMGSPYLMGVKAPIGGLNIIFCGRVFSLSPFFSVDKDLVFC